jgi:hypothetical protein
MTSTAAGSGSGAVAEPSFAGMEALGIVVTTVDWTAAATNPVGYDIVPSQRVG